MSYRVNFLVVEDNPNIRDQIVNHLNEGFESAEDFEVGTIFEAADESTACTIIGRHYIDIMLLDNQIPESPGDDADFRGARLIRRLRDEKHFFPVLMVTGREGGAPKGSQEADIMGQPHVDFIHKPYNPRVLVSRVKTLLLNYHAAGGKVRIGPWFFNPKKEILEPVDDSGQRVYLSPILSRLLLYLYLNRNRDMSLQAIYPDVWGLNDPGGTHTIQTHIYRLRELLGDKDHKWIQTVHNGYKLVL